MLSVQSLQAFSATAIARGPGGVQRLAQPATTSTTASNATADALRARRAAPASPPGGLQAPPPSNLPRGALLDRVV